MSTVPIAQTGKALSKADLNAEFPRFYASVPIRTLIKTQAASPL